MSWKEVSPGRFERPLDTIERFFKTIADAGVPLRREHWSVRLYCQFRSEVAEADLGPLLKKAWTAMRHDHPDIACTTDGIQKVYEVPDSIALQDWLSRTLIIVSDHVSVDDLMASFKPCPFPVLYYLPRKSSLILHISHWRIDGIGAINLLSNLLNDLMSGREVVFGSEGQNLCASLDEVAGFNTKIGYDQKQSALNLIQEYINGLPSIGNLPTLRNSSPGDTHYVRRSFSEQESTSIIKHCKAKKISVTTGVHTAMIKSLSDQQSGTSSKYTSWGTFNFRPYLTGSHRDPSLHPCVAYIFGLPISLPLVSFQHMADSLQRFYSQLSEPTRVRELSSYIVPYLNEVTSMFSRPPPPGMEPTEPMLESLGIVDNHLKSMPHGGAGDLTVSDFWLGAETLTSSMTFYMWTWRGQLTLSACYNESFYSHGSIEEFVERVQQTVLRELNV